MIDRARTNQRIDLGHRHELDFDVLARIHVQVADLTTTSREVGVAAIGEYCRIGRHHAQGPKFAVQKACFFAQFARSGGGGL